MIEKKKFKLLYFIVDTQKIWTLSQNGILLSKWSIDVYINQSNSSTEIKNFIYLHQFDVMSYRLKFYVVIFVRFFFSLQRSVAKNSVAKNKSKWCKNVSAEAQQAEFFLKNESSLQTEMKQEKYEFWIWFSVPNDWKCCKL